jgi:hypothetical protein
LSLLHHDWLVFHDRVDGLHIRSDLTSDRNVSIVPVLYTLLTFSGWSYLRVYAIKTRRETHRVCRFDRLFIVQERV